MQRNSRAIPPTSPLLSELIRSVEEEEHVVDKIIASVEANDPNGVVRLANELARLRRAVSGPQQAKQITG